MGSLYLEITIYSLVSHLKSPSSTQCMYFNYTENVYTVCIEYKETVLVKIRAYKIGGNVQIS